MILQVQWQKRDGSRIHVPCWVGTSLCTDPEVGKVEIIQVQWQKRDGGRVHVPCWVGTSLCTDPEVGKVEIRKL